MQTTIIALIIAAILLVFGLAWFNDSRANLIQTETNREVALIGANADAAIKNAQALVITLAAMIPMTLIIVCGVVGSVLACTLLVWVWKRQPVQPMLERQIIYVLPAGQPRRELWQMLSDTRQLQPVRRDEINIK